MFKMSYKEKAVDILGDGVGFRYERCEPCITTLVETAWYIDKIRIKWQNSVYFFPLAHLHIRLMTSQSKPRIP